MAQTTARRRRGRRTRDSGQEATPYAVSARAAQPRTSRRCRPPRPSCRRGSAAPGRTAAPSRRGSAWSVCTPVERDLDHLLRPHVRPRAPSRDVSSSRNRSVCQASISSVMPLKVLPSMTNPPVAGSRAPRWMFDSQPLPPAAAPLDGQHDEVEGVPRLDLDPAGPRGGPPRSGASSAFTTTPSWPAATRLVEERLRVAAESVVTSAGPASVGGTARGRAVEPLRPRGVEQVARRRGGAGRRSTRERQPLAQRRHVDASCRCGSRSPGTGRGRPSGCSAIDLAVEDHRVGAAAPATASTTSGSRSVMSSRLRVKTRTSSPTRCTWTRMPSSLRSTGARRRPIRSSGRRRRPGADAASIGRTGRPGTQAEGRRARRRPPVSAAAATSPRGRREHRRAAHRGDRHPGGLGDRRRAAPSPARPAGGSRRPVPAGTPAPRRSPGRTAPRRAPARAAREPAPASRLIRRARRRPRRRSAWLPRPAAAGRPAPRQPSPVRRWRGAPERYVATTSTSSALGLARAGSATPRSWPCATGSPRPRPRSATRSVSSIGPLCPPGSGSPSCPDCGARAGDPRARERERVWRPPWPCPVRADPRRRCAAARATRRTAGTPTARSGRGGARPRGSARSPSDRAAATARFGRSAWGPGAEWVLDGLPALLGADDDPSGFDAHHPVLADAWRRHPHWRVPRTRLVLDALVPAILEQKVTGKEAFGSLPARWCGGTASRRRARGRPAGAAGDARRRDDASVGSPRGSGCSCTSTTPGRGRSCGGRGRPGSLERLVDLPCAEADRRLRTLPASGCGRPPRSARGRWATPTRSASATTTSPRTSAGRSPARRSTTPELAVLLEPYVGHRLRVQVLVGTGRAAPAAPGAADDPADPPAGG